MYQEGLNGILMQKMQMRLPWVMPVMIRPHEPRKWPE